jgi:hypothetical protein
MRTEISKLSRGEIVCTSACKFGTNVLKSAYILTWYSNVLIELFQSEVILPHKCDNMARAVRRHEWNDELLWSLSRTQQFNALLSRHTKYMSLNGFLFFFRSPSLTLWLTVPRGCNKERCIKPVRFFFSRPFLLIRL